MDSVRQTLSFSIINILGEDGLASKPTATASIASKSSTSMSSCSGIEVNSFDCSSYDDDPELDSRGESEPIDDCLREEESSDVDMLCVDSKQLMKRQGRMRFTPNQIQELEKRFQKQHYLLPADRKFLAKSLHMTERQVKTWFQNKRAQYKRTRPLVRNPVYHHPGTHDTLGLSFPRLHLLQAATTTAPFGINFHLPVTTAAGNPGYGCQPTALVTPSPPQHTLSTVIPSSLTPHLPMPVAYIPVPITLSK